MQNKIDELTQKVNQDKALKRSMKKAKDDELELAKKKVLQLQQDNQ